MLKRSPKVPGKGTIWCEKSNRDQLSTKFSNATLQEGAKLQFNLYQEKASPAPHGEGLMARSQPRESHISNPSA